MKVPNFRRGVTASGLSTQVAEDTVDPANAQPDIITNRDADTKNNEETVNDDLKPDMELPDLDAQRGVQTVEAVTMTWSRNSLIGVFALMFSLYFVNAFQVSITGGLTPFITSEFQNHSLLTVINIVANSMAAAVYIPLAKILDIWGRAEGFLLMTCFATLGLILMAVSHNLPTFCAAQVFYTVGFGGMIYSIDVITADVSKLKNRGLAYAFTSSPYMITAFAGAKAAEDFYTKYSWRWGFGCFAIVLPVVASGLFILLKLNLRKARKQGILMEEKSGRGVFENIWYYIVQFDILGVFLFASGLVVFLLPFTIAESAPNGWSTGYIIAMIVVGFVVLVGFGLYEVYLSPNPMLKAEILTDRTVVGACLLQATYQISYYCWASYFSSFLMVVNNLSISQAGYVDNTFSVVSGLLLFFVGYGIRRSGYFKWLLWFAIPFYIFAQGLMIHFRRPNQSVGYLVMCQVFTSIAGAIFIITQQIAVLAAVDHQYVAASLSLLFVVGTTGGAIGNTISGAIWTNTFKKQLMKNLPESAMENLEMIYADIETQLSYEPGSPERLVIQEAYGYGQTRMLAAGTGIMALSFAWILLVRNINVANKQQTKGMVF